MANAAIRRVKLGEVAEIVSGSTPKTSVASYWGGFLPWVTPAELKDDNVVVADTARHLSAEGVASAALKPFPAGTVLLSSRAPIGKVAIAGCEMYCNQGFKNLVCSKHIYNYYLYYWLKSHGALLNSLGRGATFKEISKSIVEQIQIPLPPLPEQRRIAGVLDKIGELKRNAEARLQKLDLLVKARFNEMFGDVKKTISIGDACVVMNGFAFKSERYVPSGTRVVRITNVQQGYIEDNDPKFYPLESQGEIAKYLLRADDLLISLTGNVGRVAMLPKEFLPAALNQRVGCLRIRFGVDMLNSYLFSALNNKPFEQSCIDSARGIAQKNMSTEWLKEYKIPLPPLSLQRSFAAFVEKVEALKAVAQKEAAQVDLLYRAKLQEYFG